jgi:hypothetical protein
MTRVVASSYSLLLAAAMIIVIVTLAVVNAQSQQMIRISPNVLVSRDGEVAHVESHVAANPLNPRNLLGTAITFTSPGNGTETKAYASFDGGWTWTDTYFPDQRQQAAWDPQVGFGVTGTAYLVAMTRKSDIATSSATDSDSALTFYRSEDGGRTWSKSVYLGFNYDRNAILVDNSAGGRFRGRVYVISNWSGRGTRPAELFWSADDGRTFQGPVSTHCSQVEYPLTLTDGTLWIPCSPENLQLHNLAKKTYGGMISWDGGETLTPFVGSSNESRFSWETKPGEVSGHLSTPVYAVDTSERHRDLICALWLEGKGKNAVHVMLKYSSDRGRTWSEPRKVATVPKEGTRQYLPMATFNRDGVLGIIWFETLPPGNTLYDVFFTASLDGGASFLPPRRVTSESSKPDHPANRTRVGVGDVLKRPELPFFSAYSRWKDAGDYTGLVADGDGVFHAFWPDARRGAFQLYTSRIAVEPTPTGQMDPLASESTRVMDEELRIEFGPAVMPLDGSDEVILARLRNLSSQTIWGPLTLTVTARLVGLRRQAEKTADQNIIFDPESGQWSTRATIDYTPSLRDIPFLTPGAATEAIEWHFRNTSVGQLNLTTHVYVGRSHQK